MVRPKSGLVFDQDAARVTYFAFEIWEITNVAQYSVAEDSGRHFDLRSKHQSRTLLELPNPEELE